MDTNQSIFHEIKNIQLIPVVALTDSAVVKPLAQALIDGGVPWLEITFRNEQAIECLSVLQSSKLPIHYGAGTVRTLEQAQQAKELGCEFIVAPGFNPVIIKWAQTNQMPIIPGVDSTFAVEQALALGLSTLKFFPASVQGIKWLKAIKGPYFDVNFIPTGGLSLENFQTYLELSNVMAVAGSFLAPSNLIKAKDFAGIQQLCERARSIVEEKNL